MNDVNSKNFSWVGPLTGTFLGTLVLSFLTNRITMAKLYHFDRHLDLLFRRKAVSR